MIEDRRAETGLRGGLMNASRFLKLPLNNFKQHPERQAPPELAHLLPKDSSVNQWPSPAEMYAHENFHEFEPFDQKGPPVEPLSAEISKMQKLRQMARGGPR